MSAATHADPLLSDFPAHDPEQWRAAAEALLKGASFESALVSRTYEGIDIPPILMRGDIASLPQLAHAPGFDSLVRGSRPAGFLAAGWEVSQELRASTPVELNTLIHEGFAGGQSELNIVLADDGQTGLRIRQSAELITALDGVILDAISIWWQPQSDGLSLSAHFFDAVKSLEADPASLRGGFEDDPLGELLQRGMLTQSLENRFDRMAGLTAHCARHAPQLQTICAVGDVHHNAGASATQELAHVIATAVSTIEEMRDRGLDPAIVMPRIRIRLAVGSDIFMEIAKIRATRCLWSRIASIYGVTDAPIHIHTSTSRWNKSLDDAHTNLLRVTAEAFAAVVGGADSLHIGPFDEITGATDAFSRRIARNLHAILREECGLDRVIDPAGGSYSVEWLTQRVAEQSWDLFRAIERRGGMIAAIAEGSVQRDVASTAEARLADVRSRKQRLVGVNAYPNPNGKRLRIRHEKADDSAIHVDPRSSGATCIPLRPLRAAQAYELLRDACDHHQARHGSRPHILQLNIGPSRQYRMRADWTTSFFQVAGFDVDASRDFQNADDAATAAKTSTAPIAVIVSDDSTYSDVVTIMAAKIKSSNPSLILLLAGQPGDQESEWRHAGIDGFIHARCENYQVNHDLLQRLGAI